MMLLCHPKNVIMNVPYNDINTDDCAHYSTNMDRCIVGID